MRSSKTVGSNTAGDPITGTLGNGGYDVLDYSLDLEWDQDTEFLVGKAAVLLVLEQELSHLYLDFEDLRVKKILREGNPVGFDHEDGELQVDLGEHVAVGEQVALEVFYEGSPTESPKGIFGGGWHTLEDSAYVLGEPFGAAHWFPANDHPSDKATFSLSMTVEERQNVVSNGVFEGKEVLSDGRVRWDYAMKQPIATYLTTVVVGPYDLVDAGQVGDVVLKNAFPEDSTSVERTMFDKHAAMLVVFSELWGEYPFDTYGAVLLEEPVGGALENQSMSLFGRGVTGETIVAHELVHQWFGNSVSLQEFGDLWLNEGFATYGSYLWFEFGRGQDIESVMAQDFSKRLYPGALSIPPGSPTPDAKAIFHPSVYHRGALVLHALRLEVGDEVFFQILQNYVATYAGKNVKTEDFISLAKEESGQDLQNIFDVWLYGESIPDSLGSLDLSPYMLEKVS